MASRQTGTAVLRLLETDWQTPRSEGYDITDMLRIICRMGIMACTAGAAFYFLIDMDIMEVLVTVSERGECRCLSVLHNCLFMAIKAKLIIFRIKGRIKKRREVFSQDPEIIGAVGIMASRAVLLFYWSMRYLVIRKVFLHVHDLAAIRGLKLLVVA